MEVGDRICRNAGIKKVTMELGSNSPLIVMSDADIETKFRSACATHLTAAQCDAALGLLWRLEDLDHVSEIFRAFSIE